MGSLIQLQLVHPEGELSSWVQAIWSASVATDSGKDFEQWLQGDACCGLLFVMSNGIKVDDVELPIGTTFSNASKCAKLMHIPAGGILAGVRFHPGIAAELLRLLKSDSKIAPETFISSTDELILKLQTSFEHQTKISLINNWLRSLSDGPVAPPSTLLLALGALKKGGGTEELVNRVPIGLRQVERQFQSWVGMTPKYFQRLSRVSSAREELKTLPTTELAELAYKHGFSDQAHMTREFKAIAKVTPATYSRRIIRSQNPKNNN